MKKKIIVVVMAFVMSIGLIACGNRAVVEPVDEPAEKKELVVVGFSQVGAESDWRKANTESMIETFTRENGYELIIDDAQQKQTNQITAIRTFIQQGVDYIVLAPVTENGWDSVLGEAKEAGIPVIVVDRMVDVEHMDLFSCWVGSDFGLEGLKVAEWIHEYVALCGIDETELKIVNIQGTIGASSQIGRTSGLNSAVRRYGWQLLDEGEGEYTQAKAREEMSKMIKRHDEINVVYCENDNEAFGVIEAIEAAGLRVGNDIASGDIMVVSFDGISEQAIEFAKEGKIACIGECNPLHGPRVLKIIESLRNSEIPDKYEYVDENIYSNIGSVESVKVNDKEYEITVLK